VRSARAAVPPPDGCGIERSTGGRQAPNARALVRSLAVCGCLPGDASARDRVPLPTGGHLGETPAAREGETTSVKESRSEGGAPRSRPGRAARLLVHQEKQTVLLEQPIRLPDGTSHRISSIKPVRTRESLEISKQFLAL